MLRFLLPKTIRFRNDIVGILTRDIDGAIVSPRGNGKLQIYPPVGNSALVELIVEVSKSPSSKYLPGGRMWATISPSWYHSRENEDGWKWLWENIEEALLGMKKVFVSRPNNHTMVVSKL